MQNMVAYDVSLSVDDDGHRTYDVIYHLYASSVSENAQAVYAYALTTVPPYTPYTLGVDADARAYARRPKSVKRIAWEKSRLKWEVIIPFSTKPMKRCADTDFENPLDEPPKLSGSFLRNLITADHDRFLSPLSNSADEPEFTEVDDSRDTLVVEFNTDQVYLALRAQMRDKVNDAAIWGLGRRQVKLSQWSWDVLYFGSCFPYARNRLEFEININQWDFVRIDQGYRIKDGVDAAGNQKYRKLMDGRDQPLQKPRLLDGAGNLLAAGAGAVLNTNEVIFEADFGQLVAIGVPDPLF